MISEKAEEGDWVCLELSQGGVDLNQEGSPC